jgi:wyosine [tRNA(Phe)-imidazoG37] synthetase (radical SAM superfamily)
MWRQDVREDLMGADWVSLKVDAVQEGVWHQIDRPHGRLELARILEGALAFARSFRGHLVTETMLAAGINDSEHHLREISSFLARLAPITAYIAIPTRPPAEEWVRAPAEGVLNRAFQILGERLAQVEHLIGYEGDAFAFTGDVTGDLLSITAVHPMREDAVDAFLNRAGAKWEIVQRLLNAGRLVEAEYQDHRFYLRKLSD